MRPAGGFLLIQLSNARAYILCLENMENGTEKNKVLIDKDLCRVV